MTRRTEIALIVVVLAIVVGGLLLVVFDEDEPKSFSSTSIDYNQSP